MGAPRPAAWGGRSAPCRLRRQALSAIRVAIRLIVRILDPSREFHAARLASGNQPTRVDVSADNTAYPLLKLAMTGFRKFPIVIPTIANTTHQGPT